MLNVTVEMDRIRIGDRFSVTFQRTLRLPEDGREYPLPPGLGAFPLYPAASFPKLPAEWRERGDVFLPMYQREALWLGFDAADWKPNAVQVGVGNINAVSGESWTENLNADPQNYLVCPDQPWLDGINAGEGAIRQFVAVPLGCGRSVEAQLSSEPEAGGIRLTVFEPLPGRFPDQPPPPKPVSFGAQAMMAAAPGLGLGAGGKMRQKIYPDPYGIDVWDPENRRSIFIHIVDSIRFREITNLDPPPTPVDARTYTEYGFPWFDLYDEHRQTIAATERLRRVKPVGEIEKTEPEPLDVPPEQIWKLRH
jgi:hypothetical protein